MLADVGGDPPDLVPVLFGEPQRPVGPGRDPERRLQRWAAARRHLELTAEAFDQIGSTGWAERARSELARVGARRPGRKGELTPSEQRVVELAAAGHSNKQIAQALYITTNTVEGHLSRAYAKLGVTSRAQLTHRLQAQQPSGISAER